ncbi:MAG: hypothetical protein OXE43_08150 [Chloroflexi bacterium]|nr:hypothetical protein [Chloroflexota bacterium]
MTDPIDPAVAKIEALLDEHKGKQVIASWLMWVLSYDSPLEPWSENQHLTTAIHLMKIYVEGGPQGAEWTGNVQEAELAARDTFEEWSTAANQGTAYAIQAAALGLAAVRREGSAFPAAQAAINAALHDPAGSNDSAAERLLFMLEETLDIWPE